MSDLEQARVLLEMARKDLTALGGMADASTFAEEVFGLHVQQGAEKALKAWIAASGSRYPRTHDLTLLLEKLRGSDQDVRPWEAFVEYNLFAVQFRYEAYDEDDDPLDRASATALLRDLVERVAGVLGPRAEELADEPDAEAE